MIPPALRPLTRALWLLIALASLAVFIYVTNRDFLEPPPDCATPSDICQAAFFTLQDAQLADQLGLPSRVMVLVFLALASLARVSLALVGIIIFLRRPDDWLAWLLSATLVSVFAEGSAGLPGLLALAAQFLYFCGTLFFTPLPFLFPNGRYEPRWTRWVAWPLAVVLAVVGVWAPNTALYFGVYLVWLLLSPIALIYRYARAATPTERQQIKWVVAGFLASFVIAFNWIFIVPLFPASAPSPERLAYMVFAVLIYATGYSGLAVAIGFSILRYRLWDIDVLVRRTLIYSVLTALLALLYFGSVVVIQGLLRGLTGSESPLVIVLSTLIIAALFIPLRARVQQAIDRGFYRRKYDAARTLAAFAASARDETDLARLSDQLQQTVRETMQPEHASLWLRASEQPERRR
jgi:hypothetical protein